MRLLLAAAAIICTTRGAAAQCDPQTLEPTGEATLGEFGFDVDTDGATIVAGGRGDDVNGSDSGSVKVFEQSGETWVEIASLDPDDGDPMDFFGQSVAIDGDWLAVGSPFDDDVANGTGAVYLYQRVGGEWTFDVKLKPNDVAAGDHFGYAVALDGNRLLVGSPDDDDQGIESGSVYIYDRVGSVWSQQAKISASDGQPGDNFGTAVAVDGDRILVGSPLDDDNGIDAGSAYIYEFTTARSWSEVVKLMPLTGGTDDEYGDDVTLDGDSAAVGARKHNAGGMNAGAVYVYEFSSGSWTETQRLVPALVSSNDSFGTSVSLSGSRLLVGARLADDHGDNSGALYLFTRTDGQFSLLDKLIAPGVDAGDFFGWSCAMVDDVAVSSALAASTEAGMTGVVHVFNTAASCYCPTDIADSDGPSPDGVVNLFDLLLLLDNWGTSGDGATIAEPSDEVNLFDLLDMLDTWGDCN